MTGGSNYPFFGVGRYADLPDKPWIDDGHLKPVVGCYHLDPGLVQGQLAIMYANGQRKISIPIWFKRIPAGTFYSNVDRYMVNSAGGSLCEQHQDNLRGLLADIVAAGFSGVTLRFMPQGQSHPAEWPAWDEERYRENVAFILRTRMIADNVFGHSPFQPLYDLSGELGGSPTGQAPTYQLRLWKDYLEDGGGPDSYAYSFATGDRPAIVGDRIRRMIAAFDDANLPRPPMYAVDIYNRAAENMQQVWTALADNNEQHKPLVIQECWYNDAEEAAELKRIVGLKIRALFQWPRRRGDPRHVFVNSPLEYSAYK